MGVDFLDLSFEVENQFAIRLEPDDLRSVWMAHDNDCTVGDLHDIIVQKCRSANVPVPRNQLESPPNCAWSNRLGCGSVRSSATRGCEETWIFIDSAE